MVSTTDFGRRDSRMDSETGSALSKEAIRMKKRSRYRSCTVGKFVVSTLIGICVLLHLKTIFPQLAYLTIHDNDPGGRVLSNLLPQQQAEIRLRNSFRSRNKRIRRVISRERKCANPEYNLIPAPNSLSSQKGVTSRRHLGDTQSPLPSSSSSFSCPLLRSQPRLLEFLPYLEQVTALISKEFRTQCGSQIMVYGAAFGKQHFQYLISRPRIFSACQLWIVSDRQARPYLHQLRQQNNHTTVEQNHQSFYSSVQPHSPWLLRTMQDNLKPPLQLLVVQEKFLPFINFRRAVKLFKMNPSGLFPWAQRVLWVDAKIEIPFQYQDQLGVEWYFQKTIENKQLWQQEPQQGRGKNKKDDHGSGGLCGSVVSLPMHPNAMEGYESLAKVQFGRHCGAILKAFEYRPTVSDSKLAISSQCQHYLEQMRQQKLLPPQENAGSTLQLQNQKYAMEDFNKSLNDYNQQGGTDINNQIQSNLSSTMYPWFGLASPELDSTLIDSAVLAWDFRTPRCRDFVSRLLCDWLQEIDCFSDRDQLSFGFALNKQQEPPRAWTIEDQKRHLLQDLQLPNDNNNNAMTEVEQSDGSVQLAWQKPYNNRAARRKRNLQNALVSFASSSQVSSEYSHRVLVDKNTKQPLLFFVKSRCHWYSSRTGPFLLSSVFKCFDDGYHKQLQKREDKNRRKKQRRRTNAAVSIENQTARSN